MSSLFEKNGPDIAKKISKMLTPTTRLLLGKVSNSLAKDSDEEIKRLMELQKLQWSCTGLTKGSFSENEAKLKIAELETVDMDKDETIALRNAVNSINIKREDISDDEYDKLRLEFPKYAALREEFAYLDSLDINDYDADDNDYGDNSDIKVKLHSAGDYLERYVMNGELFEYEHEHGDSYYRNNDHYHVTNLELEDLFDNIKELW